jgi:hypothetical protein
VNRTRKATAGAALGAVLALTMLSGCSEYDDKRGKGDAPVAGNSGDDAPAEVFNFPDGFGNVATKCVGHGNRAYVTTNNNAPSNLQIIKDASCVDTP